MAVMGCFSAQSPEPLCWVSWATGAHNPFASAAPGPAIEAIWVAMMLIHLQLLVLINGLHSFQR